MVPIQAILLLLLVGVASVADNDAWPRLPALFGLVAFGVALMGLVVTVSVLARQALRAMSQPYKSAATIAAQMDAVFTKARWATLVITGGLLFGTRFPFAVMGRVEQVHSLKDSPLPEVLFLLPALFTWMIFWAISYFVEAAARERLLPYRLAHEMPAHQMPTLPQYLSMQCRHNFYVLLPVILHGTLTLGAQFFSQWVPVSWLPWVEMAMVPLGILAVLLVMPWLVVKVWSTVPLTGPLRRKFDEIAATYRLRFRNILLWKTHHGVTNAAILGWVPFARYFLMTDELLETLSDGQLEGVFAHEVGHGVHRHMWWYIAGFVGAMLLAAGLAGWWAMLPGRVGHFAGADTELFLSLVIVAGFVGLGFPVVSHRFEHQADWFACRHMAREVAAHGMPSTLHRPARGEGDGTLSNEPTAAERVTLEQYRTGQYPHAAGGAEAGSADDLPPAFGGAKASLSDWLTESPAADVPISTVTPAEGGAEVFISALDTIVESSHRSRNKKGWMHPSINGRVRLLRKLARDPEAAKGFERGMRRTRWWIAGFCVLGIAVAATQGDSVRKSVEEPAATQGSGGSR